MLHPIDLALIAAYVLGCTLLGARLGRRSAGIEGYFLGERSVPAWAVTVSIVATETSTATFLSVPGVASRGDCAYLQLAFGYVIGRFVIARWLLPLFFENKILTAYQVLAVRFGGATKTASSLLFLAARTLGDGLRLFLAANVLRELTDCRIATAIFVMGAVTIIYTYLGGMRAVIWTDVIQFVIYIAGAITALAFVVGQIPGGWNGLWNEAASAGKFAVLDFSLDPARPFTIWAGVIGGLVMSMATHGTDQLMVQRYLSARSLAQARAALISSGFVVLLQFALFLFIGVALWSFYQHHPPSRALAADDEFAYFIARVLPAGLVGLVLAAILAAAMSTLSSSLNASAASSFNDLIAPLIPNTNSATLLAMSRGLTVFWGIMQIAVAFLATLLTQSVVLSAMTITSFVSGLVLGVFILGISVRRARQTDALLGLFGGALAVSYAAVGPIAPAALYPFSTKLSWPWYALVGASGVVIVGLISTLVHAARRPPAARATNP